jgi:hypothetical protein
MEENILARKLAVSSVILFIIYPEDRVGVVIDRTGVDSAYGGIYPPSGVLLRGESHMSAGEVIVLEQAHAPAGARKGQRWGTRPNYYDEHHRSGNR